MRNWNDYKDHVKRMDEKSGRDIKNIEEQEKIITTIIEQRKALGLSQRELAELCGIPQSSVARIESFQSTPNLATLLKILRPLGLKFTISNLF